ncbi:hypothetical protein Tco_0678941 [Tanacetum coccineum]|uniref:Uncharacterized protein n=1 Tax=Tanacetum coccineum TaxID=301880 RepID=A0ABQ4XHX9_9ASTR
MPRVESVMPSGVIIEDWVSDDEDIFQSNDLQAIDKPSLKKIKFTNARNASVKPKQAKKPRMITQNPKVDRRDWNGKMTKKLGLGFGFTKKACFVCGSYNHLMKDYDFHEKRMAKKSVLKNMGKNTGQREIRPVWNSAHSINHQNKFVLSAVLTRSRRVPVSTAKQSSLRATTLTSTFRPVNTATHTNRVNVSKLRTNAFHKSHSPIRTPFHKSITPNTIILNEKVNTIRVKGVNTARQTAVSTVKGNGVTAVKALAGGDSVERAITTVARLDATQDSDNIIRTQTTAMPNVEIPQGMDTGGSPRRQDTMGGAPAQNRSERVLEKSNEPPLLEVTHLRKYKQFESSNDDLDEEDASKQGRIDSYASREKVPTNQELLEKMLNLQFEAEEESTMAFELIKFIKSMFEE